MLGGDDLAVGQLLYEALDFSHLEKFRVSFVLPLPTVGIFQFHGRLHDSSGSFPHILKVAGGVLDRRFSPIKHIAIKELTEFRQSVADQLQPLWQRGQMPAAIAACTKYERVPLDYVFPVK